MNAYTNRGIILAIAGDIISLAFVLILGAVGSLGMLIWRLLLALLLTRKEEWTKQV
jgi:hypothetical protein